MILYLSAPKITLSFYLPEDTPTSKRKKEIQQSRMRQFQIELTIIYLYKIPANVILIHSLSDDFNKYWWFFEPYESFGILLDFFQRWLGYVWHTFLFEKYYVVYPERLTVYKVREKHFTISLILSKKDLFQTKIIKSYRYKVNCEIDLQV